MLPEGQYRAGYSKDFKEAAQMLSEPSVLVSEAFESVKRKSEMDHFLITKPVALIRSMAREFVEKHDLLHKDFVSVHIRRQDFVTYCKDKTKHSVKSSKIDDFTLSVLVSPPQPSCFPSWQQMADGVARIIINQTRSSSDASRSSISSKDQIGQKDKNHEKIVKVFVMTDADEEDLYSFKALLMRSLGGVSVELVHWRGGREIEKEMDKETVGVLVEAEISSYASVFVGNRYSSVSTSVFSRRLEMGHLPSSLFLW